MDFLSNGFHQLYSELDNEFTNWDYSIETSSPLMDTIEMDNIFSSDFYNFNYDIHKETLSDLNSYELDNIVENKFEPFQTNFIQDLDLFSSYTDLLPSNDLNSVLIKNCVESSEFTNFISERTPFCNDSCNSFLKDNLSEFNTFALDSDDSGILSSQTSTTMSPLSASSASSASSSLLPASQQLKSTLNSETCVEKHFPCSYGNCTKVYAKPAHLKAHLRRHLGDKPYICNWPNCTWKFSRSDELARHRRSHSGIKPYKCTYCTKCFARSDHLSKHLKVHERKMAANKFKGILTNFHHTKPGRKPKNMRIF